MPTSANSPGDPAATENQETIPPALWCMLCLLRPHLEATGTIYRKYEDGPWRIRFEKEIPDFGQQCFALTISDQEEVVSAVQNLVEGWRQSVSRANGQWKATIHKRWKLSKLPLLSILGGTWAERRHFSRMLDWVWEENHIGALMDVLERAGEIRGWR